MKTLATLLLVVLCAFAVSAQSYKVNNGTVVKVEKASTTKAPDKVYATVDGKTFYIGPKGGIYYWAVDRNGKKVKRYVQK